MKLQRFAWSCMQGSSTSISIHVDRREDFLGRPLFDLHLLTARVHLSHCGLVPRQGYAHSSGIDTLSLPLTCAFRVVH